MKILGIHFAPLNVPLERRLQTLAVATLIVLIIFGNVIGLLMALILIFTRYRWITIFYLFWIWVIDTDISEKGGRPSTWVRSWLLWKYCRDYFPLRFEKLAKVELDPKKNYLFCCFPHGVISAAYFNAFCSEWSGFRRHFPHHTPHVVTLTQNLIIPFLRDLALALGGISSSARSIDYVLGQSGGGRVCVLEVGGMAEILYSKPGTYRVILKNRKGFVKLALKNGTPLVPVLSFGETDLYDQLEGPKIRKIQQALRKWFGLPPVLINGRGFFQYSFGILPRRCKGTTVVGIPVDVPKLEDISMEVVDHYHSEFVKRLTQLFEEQKYNYLENPEEKYLILE